ncbi:hypothetical protein M6B38_317345 [Iris pallida]|uniref:Uncharacterized protein n=1 Tax=Iris pallida TaxID=29817 RepID=A0AAX6HD31_IRIPA|nr:hypothetical protein M6B38_102530 [Iris pallida]KAJ6838949.1 hypothetical protein M6B38_317345 [Iris pallida]
MKLYKHPQTLRSRTLASRNRGEREIEVMNTLAMSAAFQATDPTVPVGTAALRRLGKVDLTPHRSRDSLARFSDVEDGS